MFWVRREVRLEVKINQWTMKYVQQQTFITNSEISPDYVLAKSTII